MPCCLTDSVESMSSSEWIKQMSEWGGGGGGYFDETSLLFIWADSQHPFPPEKITQIWVVKPASCLTWTHREKVWCDWFMRQSIYCFVNQIRTHKSRKKTVVNIYLNCRELVLLLSISSVNHREPYVELETAPFIMTTTLKMTRGELWLAAGVYCGGSDGSGP